MSDYNKYDSKINPRWDPDVLVEIDFYKTDKKRIYPQGFCPNHNITNYSLVGGQHFYIDKDVVYSGERVSAFIKFIGGEEYGECLWLGRRFTIQCASVELYGEAKIIEIYNSAMEREIPSQEEEKNYEFTKFRIYK